MSAKHTPGPWTYWPGVAYPLGVVTRDASAGHIATPSNCGECTEANARLIAAAPDLLKALEVMVKRIEYYSAVPEDQRPCIEQWEYTNGSGDMANARAAITKAKGE